MKSKPNKKTRKEYELKYRRLHKKEINNYAKKYRKKHKKEIKKYAKNWYQKNKNKILKMSKKWYIKHRELKRLQYFKNKKKINKYRNIYQFKRRKKDINFKILCNLRRRLHHVLKNENKSVSTIKLLGCSIDFLKKHLKSKFAKGMSWSNYGKWHIDHIVPCASFDFSKPSEQRKCFNYKNLQPLWALDNLRKNKNE